MSRKRDIARLREDVKELEAKVEKLECLHPWWEFKSNWNLEYWRECASCLKKEYLSELNWLKERVIQAEKDCGKTSSLKTRIAQLEEQEGK